jgi:hypothetical protein
LPVTVPSTLPIPVSGIEQAADFSRRGESA